MDSNTVLFQKEFYIFPVFSQCHWLVAIAFLVRKSCNTHCSIKISIMDSLQCQRRSSRVFKVLEKYFDKKLSSMTSEFNNELLNITKEVVYGNRQNNSFDCGPFSIYFIHKFFKDLNYNSTINFLSDSKTIGPAVRNLLNNIYSPKK